MEESAFNTKFQQSSLTSKIVVSLERISEVFKSLLWEYTKKTGISPIQIQILIFVAYHKKDLCKVSHLAKEFNITKPTISDAVKVLEKKELIRKRYSPTDSRTYTISLTETGEKMAAETEKFAQALTNEVDKIEQAELETLYKSLNQVIYNLNQAGILTVQRTCFACNFYGSRNQKHYCELLSSELATQELRVDCPEFEKRASGT
ncbi:MAG TPA: MarR family transcriptional regulator [Bacteroidetes bacterium]|nr:MarR family transcriptional regulator [Bacteroidota bacterium]